MIDHLRLTGLVTIVVAGLVAGGLRTADADVIFQEDFTDNAAHSGVFGTTPDVNVGNSFFVRSDRLASATHGNIGFYGDQSLNIKGLLFEPLDGAGEMLASQDSQNMTIPYDYTFNNNEKVRLTVTARTYDPYDSDGIAYWNNFAFGFTDTVNNLSNFVLLHRNPDNINRTHAQIWHNGKIYRTNLPAPAVNAEFFRELALEFDPTKVNIPETNPYTLIVDGVPHTLRSVNNEGHNLPQNPPDVGLPVMTTDGGQTFGNINGIGWGFWFPNETHPVSEGFLPKSVLIQSMKFETIPLSTPGQAGDYNSDGIVDAADYVVWRKGIADGDYNTWQENFGAGGSGSGGSAVPEPSSAVLVVFGLLLVASQRREAARIAA